MPPTTTPGRSRFCRTLSRRGRKRLRHYGTENWSTKRPRFWPTDRHAEDADYAFVCPAIRPPSYRPSPRLDRWASGEAEVDARKYRRRRRPPIPAKINGNDATGADPPPQIRPCWKIEQTHPTRRLHARKTEVWGSMANTPARTSGRPCRMVCRIPTDGGRVRHPNTQSRPLLRPTLHVVQESGRNLPTQADVLHQFRQVSQTQGSQQSNRCKRGLGAVSSTEHVSQFCQSCDRRPADAQHTCRP